MSDKKITASIGKVGMNKDSNKSSLRKEEYSHAKNTNLYDEFGNGLNLQSEHSNILTTRFGKDSADYKVLGFKNHVNKDRTYYFLTNVVTGDSEIGYIGNVQNIENENDLQVNCTDCDIVNKLNTPLEDTEQQPTHQYTVLLEDSCNKCLNFSIDFPIFYVEIKEEVTGTKLYWTDFNNPQRYLDVDNLEKYKVAGEIVCGEDQTEATCVDCDKLRMHPLFHQMHLEADSLQTGGNLRKGSYEFLAAYCNEEGTEMSEYHSITQPIYIFDVANREMSQKEIADRTNFAIKLKVTKTDKKFHFYKVAVIQRADIDQATSYFIEGIHPVTDTSIIYTSEDNKIRTDINTILQTRPNYIKAEKIAASNDILFQVGVEQEAEWNLQPVVNFLGSFAKWLTIEASEQLYENGVLASKYKTRMRDEVYAHAIKFITDTGYYTANFPLISRPPTQDELQEINNLDTQSVLKNAIDCTSSERNKKWQFYNTATNEGVVDNYKPSDETTFVPITKYCITESVEETGAGTMTLPLEDFEDFVYTDLKDFLKNYYDLIVNYDCTAANANPGICTLKGYLTTTYPDCNPDGLFPTCEPGEDGSICCEEPELMDDDTELIISTVVGETATFIEKVYVDESDNEYSKVPAPDNCYYYNYGNDGLPINDWALTDMIIATGGMFFRQSTVSFEKCSGGEEISFKTDTAPTGQGYYMDYYGTHMDDITTVDDLKQDKNIPASATGMYNSTVDSLTVSYTFYDKLHLGAIWFKGKTQGENRFILEITKGSIATCLDPDILRASKHLRVSIWNSCSDSNPIWSEIRHVEDGVFLLIDLDQTTGPDWSLITNGSFYVSVDSPITEINGVTFTFPTCSCFSIFTRPVEYKEVTIDYDSIIFDLQQKYIASCKYYVPQPNDCNPQTYERGKFAYWESLEEYPDNPELYDSSKLTISPEDIPLNIRTEFEENYVVGGEEVYNLKNSNFICKPIRHFKYPDSNTTSFITNVNTTPFSNSIIYPIGFTIDENVINAFLDLAVKNKLITQEQRDSVVGYEIMASDRVGNKSIQAKGLAYDSMTYQENNKTVEYSNFPFNDLGVNKLFKKDNGQYLTHPYSGTENNKFMFLSPDLYVSTGINPTEINIEGYMFGNSKQVIKEVEDHPEWVILGRKAKRTATQFATLEATSEILMMAMNGMEVFRFDAGVVVSLNIAGIVLYIVNLAFAIANAFVRVGRYRLEWLKIIRDLGTPMNFASRNTGVGVYGFLGDVPKEDSRLRGVSGIKKLKDGLQTVTDRQGKISYINNTDREGSLYLSMGEGFEIEYPDNYTNYDNNQTNYSSSSRFISSEEQCAPQGSQEYIKNVASPYFSLKNYMPNQYGTIDSVKWLTTSYKGALNNPQELPRIFGGDIFISRFAEIRKVPLFLVTAMGQADLTPFEYKRYSNLGKNPGFYCNYESGGDTSLGSILFPDFDSDYYLDCLRDTSGFYVGEPAKFYLYYHGIASYMVESEINCNFRYAKEGLENAFYPEEQDYIKITEQSKRPIREPNRMFYNNTYSKQVSGVQYKVLPSTFDRALYDKIAKGENSVIYSEQDNSEFDKSDPWLIYKPNNYFHFSTANGKLMDLRGIESAQMLARFENMYAIFNAVDNIDRITPESAVAGTGGIFARRPLEFNRTELGYAGTQHKAMVSCEFGHFWADADRGQVFCLQPGARDPQEISRIYNNQPTNMRSWFKEHLPFKIKRVGGDTMDMDNNFKGVGITMGWDSRYERVFLTKRDYEPLIKDICYSEGHFYDSSPETIDLLIAQYETEDWEFKGIESCKLIFEKDLTGVTKDCIESLRFVVAYRELGGIEGDPNPPVCYGGHLCNRAVFDVVGNGITIGQISLNNGAGAMDLGNRFPEYIEGGEGYVGQHTRDRYNEFVVDSATAEALALASPDGTIDLAFICACVSGVNCQSANCHQDVSWMRIYKDGVEIYNGCPQGNILEDFIPCTTTTETSTEKIEVPLPEIEPTDTDKFKDVSWTVAFSPITGKWISFYDFKPNYYVAQKNYFQTGINYSTNGDEGEFGLWSHLLTNRSYQVFYGKAYDWEIEIPTEGNGGKKMLETASYIMESLRYHNDYDYAENSKVGFDEMVIWNNTNNSGKLKLINQTSLAQINKYPKTNGNKSQDILQVNDEGVWSINYFYNRVKNQNNNVPLWLSDENQIDKELNQQAVSFYGKKVLERMRGQSFLINFKSKDTQHKKIFKLSFFKEDNYL